MNLEMYKQLCTTYGLETRDWAQDFLTNPIYQQPELPLVLAAGTSSGKTIATLLWAVGFYSDKANKHKHTLIIPSAQVILRDNFGDTMDRLNAKHKFTFDYAVVKDGSELKNAINNNIQVIVCLPQTLINNVNALPAFDNLILDEAHIWYFQKTIQNIISKTSPKQQLLLTGSPSPFIAKADKFIFKFVPVEELYKAGLVSNVKIEVVSSAYDIKKSECWNTQDNLRGDIKLSHIDNKASLYNVCYEMLKSVSNPFGKKISVTKTTINNVTKNYVGKLFTKLNKSVIVCHSKLQADDFHKVLKQHLSKNEVLLSHSTVDKMSESFKRFESDSNIKILIVVDRGRIGWDMPELYNIIDFSLTQNLDVLLQLFGRLLRLSALSPDTQKIF